MKKKSQIAIYVTNDLTYDQRMQRISSALSSDGYEVTLIGRQKSDTKESVLLPVKTHLFNCMFNSGALFYAEINIRIFFHLLFSRANIACAVDLDTIAGVSLASKIKNIPFVFDAHEWFSEVPELIDRKRTQSIWKKIEHIFVPKSKERYTVNQSLADIFTKKFNLPFGVIRNVPALAEKNNVEKAEKKTIIYQGALNAGRGIEASIRAMDSLPDFQLWLVGEGDLSSELRELAQNSGVADRVIFHGFKTPEELRRITPMAHVGLNLLEGQSQNYYYSLANKFFDYMQAGIPSINMSFPEYSTILEQYPCGLMIDTCEAIYVANAIKELFTKIETYNTMVIAANEAASKFNWESEKEKLLQIWRDLN